MAVVRIGEAAGKAKILPETDELIFRGEVRGKVAFKALTVIEPGADGLRLVWPGSEVKGSLVTKASALPSGDQLGAQARPLRLGNSRRSRPSASAVTRRPSSWKVSLRPGEKRGPQPVVTRRTGPPADGTA